MIIRIANRLKELRLHYGLSQAQVAKMCNVTKNTISAYENGTRQPSYETLVRLSVIYRVSTDYLLGVTDSLLIDTSGVTQDDIAAVSQLIKLLLQKNELIQKRSSR